MTVHSVSVPCVCHAPMCDSDKYNKGGRADGRRTHGNRKEDNYIQDRALIVLRPAAGRSGHPSYSRLVGQDKQRSYAVQSPIQVIKGQDTHIISYNVQLTMINNRRGETHTKKTHQRADPSDSFVRNVAVQLRLQAEVRAGLTQ
jgi:hypothetical protein